MRILLSSPSNKVRHITVKDLMLYNLNKILDNIKWLIVTKVPVKDSQNVSGFIWKKITCTCMKASVHKELKFGLIKLV